MSSTATAAATHWVDTSVMSATGSQDTRLAVEGEGADGQNLGSPVGPNAFELFAACPPAQALELLLERQRPTYIALHDVGIAASERMLSEMAIALKRPIQTLAIRKQGMGINLATLKFVELPSSRGTALRLFSTSADAETTARAAMADVLLANSRLAVLLVGPLPDHMISAQFALLRERLLRATWTNRNILAVPQGAMPTLPDFAARAVRGTHIQANTSAPAHKTASIWKAIHRAWTRLREVESQASGPPAAPLEQPPQMPGGLLTLALAPAPVGGFGAAPEANGAPNLDFQQPVASASQSYALACSGLRGARGSIVFERESLRLLALAGRPFEPAVMVAHAAKMLDAADGLSPLLGEPDSKTDCRITMGNHLIMAHAVEGHPQLGAVVVLDKARCSPSHARNKLQTLDNALVRQLAAGHPLE